VRVGLNYCVQRKNSYGVLYFLTGTWCVPNFDYSLIIEGAKSVCKRQRERETVCYVTWRKAER